MAQKSSVKIKRTINANRLSPTGGADTPTPDPTKIAEERAVERGDAGSKTNTILTLLRSKNGATLAELSQATGWQTHSIRGFLSGTVKKKLNLTLTNDRPEGDERHYFVREKL